MNRLRLVALGVITALLVTASPATASATNAEAAGYRHGMTWTVLGEQNGAVHVGADGVTDPYHGDTTIDQFLPILCLLTDGRGAPGGLAFDFYNGWARGQVRATPPIAATVLTSRAAGDEICATEYGEDWHLAEFHDGRYGDDFSQTGGWTFWAAGTLPAGTRFWTAIEDQAANPWDSAGETPAVSMPKFVPAERPVAGQYLAMLPEGVAEDAVAGTAEALLAQYGGALLDLLPAAGGFSFTGTDAQARAMAADSRVETVDQDSYGDDLADWHLDRIDQREQSLSYTPYAPANTGAGVTIYVLDTGFRRSHAEFGGRASQAVDFIRFAGSRDDCNGHGTGVGSAAGGATVGVAPGATLVSVRIAGCKGTAWNPFLSVFNSTIVAGLDWVARFGSRPSVANVSYGADAGFWRRWFKIKSPIDRAAKRVTSSGITVFAAAGNESRSVYQSPARSGDVVTVSATDSSDKRSSFGNWGKVDLFAPGEALHLATYTGDSDYDTVRGTSFSSPMAAGAAAIYLADHPSAGVHEVRNALYAAATKNAVTDERGSQNRLLYVGAQRGNIARSAAASASSTFSGYSAARVNDGSTSTALGGAESWANAAGTYPPANPEWVQLDFGSARSFSKVVVYTTSGYAIRDFDIQVESGGVWTTIPGTAVRGNAALSVPLTFAPHTAQRVRILARHGSAAQPGYARVNEFEVWTR